MFKFQLCKRLTKNILCICNCRSIHCSRSLLDNHYDTLGLKRNCSSKEIRDAYIKLSKKYHPDRNSNDESKHQQFQKINLAYSILSKPSARREYDRSTTYIAQGPPRRSGSKHDLEEEEDWRRTWGNPIFYHNRKDLDYNVKDDEYYGIKGIKRVSNAKLVTFLIIFSFVVFILQLIVIRFASRHRQRLILEKEEKLRQSMEELEDRAAQITTEEYYEQLERDYNVALEKNKRV